MRYTFDVVKFYEEGKGYFGKYSSGFIQTVINLCSHRENSLDKQDIIEKVELSYQGETPHINFRGELIKVDELLIEKFLVKEKDYKKFVLPDPENAATEICVFNVESSVSKREVDLVEAEKKLEETIEELKRTQELEIERIRKEFQLKMSQTKVEVAKQMAPLINDIENMKDKICIMEKNIYSHLLYNGINYEIKPLSEGDSAKEDEKFVVWQKVRYLDEELPKLLCDDSIMEDVEFGEFRALEGLMSKYNSIRDFFIPSQKGCVVFQLSRNNNRNYYHKRIQIDKNDPYHPWIEYVKQSYEVFNWNKLGVFLKNGDNSWVIWLDADKVNIKSDNVFLTKSSQEIDEVNFTVATIVDEVSEEYQGSVAMDNLATMKNNYKKRRELFNKQNSRVYIADMLQGLIDNKPELLGTGETSIVTALELGSYGNIVFNNSDGMISYQKYENFKSILEEIKGEYKKGDPIYVPERIDGRGRARNINENVSNDATIRAGINYINKIDYNDNYYWTKEVTEDMLEFNPDRNDYRLKKEYASARMRTRRRYGHDGEFISESSYVDNTTTIEGWLTDNLGEAPVLEVNISHIDDVKRVEEPTESRIKMIKLKKHRTNGVLGYIEERIYSDIDSYYNPNNWSGSRSLEYLERNYPGLHKGADGSYYYPLETNKVHEEYKRRVEHYIELGFAEDLSRRSRKEHLYVSCKKEWSDKGRVNVLIEKDEFIPLKNMTLEHVNYTINQGLPIQGCRDYAESIKHILNIRKFIKERNISGK